MENIIEFPFGKAYCREKYVYFERNHDSLFTTESAQELLKSIYSHYGNQKFIYISHRKLKYIVDLESYKFVKNDQMIGIAVVSEVYDPEKDLLKEQELFDGAFAFFKSLDQAISWAETFDFD